MPLRVGICGLGTAAIRAHLPALQERPDVTVAALCDRNAERVRSAAALTPAAGRWTDLDAMLSEASLDLVVIATPPSAHVEEVCTAVDAGVDVVCEKPAIVTPDGVARLAAVTHAHPERAIVSVHQYAWAPAWAGFERMIAAAIASDEEWMLEVDVERPGTDPLAADGWRSDTRHEGGILGDHAVHYLALVWRSNRRAQVTGCERSGPGGREQATVRLSVGSGSAEIRVSYASASRVNRIRLRRPAQCLDMIWTDSTLRIDRSSRPGSLHNVAALSNRDIVNSLYVPFYDDVFAHRSEPLWRQLRTDETLGVAGLLAACLERTALAASA